MTELFNRIYYLNKNIEYLFGDEIVEYDIKSAGFNIIKKYNLLSSCRIEYLETLPKESRNKQIGLYKREDKKLDRDMKEHIKEMRKLFIQSNDIGDNEILSIKNDAIYLINRVPEHVKFDNILFVRKNVYSSYLYLNKFEIYMNKDIVHLKGINDIELINHKDYMLDFMKEFSKLMENSTSQSQQIRYIKEFANAYRNKELDNGYYRELNQESLFRPKENISFMQSLIGYTEYGGDLDKIDISYNYMRYIIPMYRILI